MKLLISNKSTFLTSCVVLALGWFTLQSFHAGAGTTESNTTAELTCDPPNAYVTQNGEGAIGFAWASTGSGVTYRASYELEGQPKVNGSVTTSNTSVTFDELTPGRYKFTFCTICGSNQSNDYIIYEIVIL
jgi:hypothetical protein